MAWDYDVIIVGGGGAGLAAAIEAKRAGANCIILEADTKLGGATAQSGGVFYAADTSVQRAAGIDDSAEDMFQYLMTLNHWSVKPDIFRILADESGPTLEWLIAEGTEFLPEQVTFGGIEAKPRAHPSHGAGTGIAETLINTAGALGIETALGTRVERLLLEDGQVIGVHAAGIDLRAPSVILTTGGFGNSPEMIARFFPTAARKGDWTWAVHHRAPYILGDGIRLGEQVDARIVGHDTGLLLPGSNAGGKALEPFLPPWLMLVNREGRRFIPETSSYTISGYAVNEQTDEVAFAIFDERALVEASSDLSYLDPYGSGIEIPTWEEPMLRERVAKGEIQSAVTLDLLCARIGIDPKGLAETVRTYNEDCALGVDSHYFQKLGKRYPVSTGPFYAAEIRAAVIAVTGAGLDINRDCAVLDSHGRPVPGLYAAGEVLGVLMGKRYGGGGMSIGPAIVLGRRAGIHATLAARSTQQTA